MEVRTHEFFDWTGNARTDIARDAEKFSFKIDSATSDNEGFIVFVISGSKENLDAFEEFYNLDEDD